MRKKVLPLMLSTLFLSACTMKSSLPIEESNTPSAQPSTVIETSGDAISPETEAALEGLSEESARETENDKKRQEMNVFDQDTLNNAIPMYISSVYQCSTNDSNTVLLLQRNGNELKGYYTNNEDDKEYQVFGKVDFNGKIELSDTNGDEWFTGTILSTKNSDELKGNIYSKENSSGVSCSFVRTGTIHNNRDDRYTYLQYTDKESYQTDEVEDFAIQLKNSIKNSDINTIAEMLEYPLTVNGKIGAIASAEDFKKNYQTIITDSFKNHISKSVARYLGGDSNGLNLANGAIWLHYNTEENSLKVYAINVIE